MGIVVHSAVAVSNTAEPQKTVMISQADFEQAVLFMFSDIERELKFARLKPENITSLGINPGGGNLLAALGLLCYTEFGGKFQFGHSKASQNFNAFFDTLGPPYVNFHASHNVYDIFRCGLAHEYYVKKNCTIYMFGSTEQPGIGVDSTGRYWFVVENYAQDLKVAFKALGKQLFGISL